MTVTDNSTRPRNAAATSAAILEAAKDLFASSSYDDVGMRDIAGDAGVDPALIVRYFCSKEGLFRAALDHCHEGSDLLDGPRETFGARIAREIVHGPRNPGKMQAMQMILRSMSSSKAIEVVQERSCARFMTPFADWIGGSDAMIRARMASAVMMGMTVGKEITGGLNLDEAECRTLESRLAILLQDIVDGA